MADKFKKISDSRVEFPITITEEDLQASKQKVIEQYRAHVAVSGFRKGHAPDDMVVARVGVDAIAEEALNDSLNKAYQAFVTDNDLQVINRPELDFPKEQKMPMTVKIAVEVYPEVKVGDYKKIKVKKPEVKIKDSDIDDVIETVLAQMQEGKKVTRAAKDKDMVEADFAGKDDKGEIIPNTNLEKNKFRIGMGHYLPDLEKAFVGMKAGESKEKVPVKFPKDYHSPDFAGKTVKFDIKLYEVYEISAKDISEEQIEKVMGKKQKVDEFRADIKQNVETNKQREAEQAETDKYTKEVGKLTKGDLPKSWIDKEVQAQFQRLTQNPQFQQNPEAFLQQMGDQEKLKKEFAVQGEENLRVFLGLTEIVNAENIELDKDETVRAMQQAQQSGKDENIEFERISLNMKIDKYLASLFA